MLFRETFLFNNDLKPKFNFFERKKEENKNESAIRKTKDITEMQEAVF